MRASTPFRTDARIDWQLPASHRAGCRCALHQRRRFTGLVAAGAAAVGVPAWARDGVQVGGESKFARFVPAADVEQSALQQYRQLQQEAASKHALAPDDHPQAQRLHAIAARIRPYSYEWNERARNWQWEVSLIGSNEVNAFCMPGGKIAFYTGILTQLQLTDSEVAIVMGHEMTHALREHARERMGKQVATQTGASVLSALLGLGSLGNAALGYGAQLMTLRWSRGDETEADTIGLDLAARSGYDPHAGVSLWKKMMALNQSAPPQWLSTHPANATRIHDMEVLMPRVLPLYARADKPTQHWAPMAARASAS